MHGGDRLGPDATARRALTQEIAESLYVGLVTDTGKFMYENTGPRAHLMAADLIDARRRRRTRSTGACTRACRTGKLQLLARGLSASQRFDDGR